jgi:hypothetical protein
MKQKNKTFIHYVLFTIILVFSNAAVAAVSSKDEVRSFVISVAEHMCGSLSQSGSTTEAEAKLSAEVGLKNLLAKIVNPKLKGEIGGNIKKYTNVLQKDLLESHKSIRDCNIKVLDRLMDFVQPKPAASKISSQLDASKATQMSSLSPGICGSSVYVYRDSLISTTFTPQRLWLCKDFSARKVASGRVGLTPADALLIDGHRGKIDMDSESTKLYWGESPENLLSVRLKNTGPVTVRIDTIKVLHASVNNAAAWPDAVKVPFIIFPNESVIVPIARIDVMARGIRNEYSIADHYYDVQSNTASLCDTLQYAGTCNQNSSGFGVGVKYTDIFGDRYQFNKLEYFISVKLDRQLPMSEQVLN